MPAGSLSAECERASEVKIMHFRGRHSVEFAHSKKTAATGLASKYPPISASRHCASNYEQRPSRVLSIMSKVQGVINAHCAKAEPRL